MKIISAALLLVAVLILTGERFVKSDLISAFLTGLGVTYAFIAGHLDAKADK